MKRSAGKRQRRNKTRLALDSTKRERKKPFWGLPEPVLLFVCAILALLAIAAPWYLEFHT